MQLRWRGDVMRAFRDLCWFSSRFFFLNNKTLRQSIQNTAEDVKAGKKKCWRSFPREKHSCEAFTVTVTEKVFMHI